MKKRIIFSICICLPLGLAAQTYTLPYTQDFESGTFLPAGWQAFGANGNAAWQLSATVGAYNTSSGSAYFDNFSVNVSGNYYGMRCVPLDLSGAVHPMMRFDVAYARRDAQHSDRLGIWYSYNGTSNWNNLVNYQNGTLTTAPDQNVLFVPTADQWDSVVIDLSQFAGTAYIRFAFENNSDNGNIVYIDNVRFYDAASTTGMDGEEEQELVVFPNPSSGGQVWLESANELQQVHLYAADGREMAVNYSSVMQGRMQLETTGVPPGLYTIRAFGGGRWISKRLVIR